MGIQVETDFRGIPLKEAYIRFSNIGGSKKIGWNGSAQLYYNKKLADAGEQPIYEFMVVVLGPDSPNADKNAPPVPAFNPNAFEALYAKLKESYPKYMDV